MTAQLSLEEIPVETTEPTAPAGHGESGERFTGSAGPLRR